MSYMMVLVLLLSSVNLAAMSDGVSDLEAVNTALVNKFNTGEISALTELYSKNAVMLPPSSEILTGADSIKGYWDQLRSIGVTRYSIYPVDFWIEGNVAYSTSLWEASRETAGNDVITMDGNISSVFEKQEDGSWKIKLQSWN